MLVMGGRLVCFYPVLREDDVENHFPEHPCLKLIVSSEQIPSSRYSQVLLTIVKTVSYTDKIAEAAKIKHQEFKENYVKW
jgi:tRNA (guanine10-N2)-methyltransferase